MRQELLEMRTRGKLRIAYVIEFNEKLKTLMSAMLKKDLKAQYLMGDALKQDAFRFFYDSCNIIFESALVTRLLSNDEKLLNDVIPMLIAFRSVLHISKI